MTPFERFERRLFARMILIVVGGGMLFWLIHYGLTAPPGAWPRDMQAVIGLFALTCWLGASWSAVARLRGKHEAVGAYKRRVGYRGAD